MIRSRLARTLTALTVLAAGTALVLPGSALAASPVCTGSSSATVSHGHTVSAPFSCSDADGDAFTVSVLSTTEGTATVSGSDVVYDSDVNDDGFAGPQTITLQATEIDDTSVQSAPFDVNVQVTDEDPVCVRIGPYPVEVSVSAGSTADLPFSCTDADGDPLLIAAQNPLFVFALVDQSLVRFTTQSWMTDGDTYRYAFDALELPGGSRAGSLQLPVLVVADMRPACTIAGAATRVVSHTAPTTFTYSCTDPEGDAFTPALSPASYGAVQITSPGVITYTPTPGSSYLGADSFELSASEDSDPSRVSYPVSVDLTLTDTAPVCAQTGVVGSVHKGATTTLTYSCTDADGDALEVASWGVDDGSATRAGFGAFSYVTSFVGPASQWVNVGVRESAFPAVTSSYFLLSVGTTDEAPVCTGSTTSVVHGQSASGSVSCSDSEGDPFTVQTVASPADGSAQLSGSNVAYDSIADSLGPQAVQVHAVEDGNPAVSSNVATVSFDVTDQQPVCVQVGTATVHPGATTTIDYSCTDADGDPLSATSATTLLNAIWDTGFGTISFDATGLSPGPQLVYVQATEDNSGQVASGFTPLTVTVTNASPVCAQANSSTITLGQSASLAFGCSDSDGDPLSYSLYAGGTHGSTILTGANATYTPTATGTDTVIVTAFDPWNSTGFAWTITVLPVVTPPVIDPSIVAPVIAPPLVAPVVPAPVSDPVAAPPVVVSPPLVTGPTRIQVEQFGALAQNTLSVLLTCPAAMGRVCKAFVRPSGKGYVRSLGARAVTVRLGVSGAFRLTIPGYAARTLRAYAGKNLRFMVTVTTRDSAGKLISVRKQIVVHVPR